MEKIVPLMATETWLNMFVPPHCSHCGAEMDPSHPRKNNCRGCSDERREIARKHFDSKPFSASDILTPHKNHRKPHREK